MDLVLAVEELSVVTSQDLSKMLKESESLTVNHTTRSGSVVQIDVEKLARSLPLHLIAMLVASTEDDFVRICLRVDGLPFNYFLSAVRLLHSMADLVYKHTQIVIDDVKISEQVLDLVFYMLLFLARYGQDDLLGVCTPLLHSALVACSFHLLTNYISSHWKDLVHVLLAHPKVDIFIDVAFDAVHVDIRFLHDSLSSLDIDVLNGKCSLLTAERTANSICQNCEASLQFITSLCQQKVFRDHVLKNKELCKNGGILSLSQSILDLNISKSSAESSDILSTICRLKSKMLSILVQLCEAEDISYLDEVAGSLKSMSMAKGIVLKILDLLKAFLGKEAKLIADSLPSRKPNGLMLLNSMRLADIFSDDSNFRSFFMANSTSVIAEILARPRDLFLSSWCSPNSRIVEQDAAIDYDPFVASGIALASLDKYSETQLPSVTKENGLSPGNRSSITQTSYSNQRTSFLVKIIANLHCYVPNVCQEQEKDQFLNKFSGCLDMSETCSLSLNYDLQRAHSICTNLSSLKLYARSLIPKLLNDEDVDLLSQFHEQLLALIPQSVESSVQKHFTNDVGDSSYANISTGCKDSHAFNENLSDTVTHQNSLLPSPQTTDRSLLVDVRRDHFVDEHAENENLQFPQGTRDDESSINNGHAIDVYGVSEAPACHEPDKSSVICKPKDLSDGTNKLEQKTTSPIGSGSVKDNRDLKIEPMSSNMNNMEGSTNMMVDTGECLHRMDSMKESDMSKSGQVHPEELHTRMASVKEPELSKASQDDEKPEALQGEEKHPRKRKRNIMNDRQISLIENALLDEPEMQRNAPMLQSWADKLSLHGSELTPSQLKNWLNNRKARLARAAREARASSEGENVLPDRSGVSNISHFYDSPESGADDSCTPNTRSNNLTLSRYSSSVGRVQNSMGPARDFVGLTQKHAQQNRPSMRPSQIEIGQKVSVVDAEARDVGWGMVRKLDGRWHDQSLDSRTCVVSIMELKVERSTTVQHPSEAAGTTFEEAEARNGGVMYVVWDTSMVSCIAS